MDKITEEVLIPFYLKISKHPNVRKLSWRMFRIQRVDDAV